MNVNELVDYLDFIEHSILFDWGCPNFRVTLDRLELLMDVAVDPMMKEKLFYLRNTLVYIIGEENYVFVYFTIRKKLEESMAKRYEIAKQFKQMKRDESTYE